MQFFDLNESMSHKPSHKYKSWYSKADFIKANGQFWYMVKMKMNILGGLMQNFIELYELLMPVTYPLGYK